MDRRAWQGTVPWQGVRPLLEGKQRTPLSSRVASGMSWSPLSGLLGVKPPVEPNPSGAQILLQLEPERRFGRLSKAGLLLPDLLVRVKQGKWHQTHPARRLLVVPAQPQLQPRIQTGKRPRQHIVRKKALRARIPLQVSSECTTSHFLLASWDEDWPAGRHWLCPGKLLARAPGQPG